MMNSRIWNAVAALTILHSASSLAEDSVVLQASIGTGASQRVELIVDNNDCGKFATVTVVTTDTDGLITHESTHVVQQSAAVIPLPAPSTSADRTLSGLSVAASPGSCDDELATALAIIDGDGATADIRHSAEWTDFNTHDPGLTVAKSGQNNLVLIPPSRVGPGQTAEIVFWSNCRDDTVVDLDVTDLSTGVRKTVDLLVPASQTSTLLIAADPNDPPMYFRALGTVSGAASQRNPCPRGSGAMVVTMSLVDEQGNTVASGLPTGKRQHKPVSTTKSSG